MRPQIPESMRLEHARIHGGLEAATRLEGPAGEAARELALPLGDSCGGSGPGAQRGGGREASQVTTAPLAAPRPRSHWLLKEARWAGLVTADSATADNLVLAERYDPLEERRMLELGADDYVSWDADPQCGG